MTCTDLRTDFRIEPNCIDDTSPLLSWLPPAGTPGIGGYHIRVASQRERLEQGIGDLWDTGQRDDPGVVSAFYEGPPVASRHRVWWTVRSIDAAGTPCDWAEPASFRMGLLAESDWDASWISNAVLARAGHEVQYPRFRREFELPDDVVKATLYWCALGYGQPFVNGECLSQVVLEPQVTRYDKLAYYLATDVGARLRRGTNAVAFWLASGFYHAKTEIECLGHPVLRAQLEVELVDGTKVVVATDESWLAGPGPVYHNGRCTLFDYGGEVYDDELEQPEWASEGFTDRSWTKAVAVGSPTRKLRAAVNEPNAVAEVLRPVSTTDLPGGRTLYDFGTSVTARLRTTVGRSPWGGRVELRAYDWLGDDGEPEILFNQIDYIVSGPGKRPTWCSPFHFRGFRYVEARSDASFGPPAIEDLVAEVVSNALDRRATFESSDPMLAAIEETNRRTLRMLMLGGLQFDCSNREKLGYGQEGLQGVVSSLFHFDLFAFLRKWLRDWRADQDPQSGLMPWASPAIFHSFGFGGGPTYGTMPQHMSILACLHSGDNRFLADQHDASMAYLRFLAQRIDESGDRLVPVFAPGADLDTLPNYAFVADWLTPSGNDRGFDGLQGLDYRRRVVSMQIADSFRRMAWAARRLERTEDAQWCEQRFADLSRSLRDSALDDATGTWGSGTQAEQALAYVARLDRDESSRSLTLERLVAEIDASGRRLTTGVLGTYYLLEALIEARLADVAYEIITNADGPSWGRFIAQGATTWGEDWTPGKRSQIHSSFACVGSWFYRALGGICMDEEHPGFRHTYLRPQIPAGASSCSVTLNTPYGELRSGWAREDARTVFRITVPPGASATAELPESVEDHATSLGLSTEPSGIAGCVAIRLAHGTYEIATTDDRIR